VLVVGIECLAMYHRIDRIYTFKISFQKDIGL